MHKNPNTPSLSPGNPKSPLYPDGVIHPKWVGRYRDFVPSVVIAYFELTETGAQQHHINPLEPQRADVEMCDRINALKRQIGDRSKFVVVVVTPRQPNDASVDERGLYIRKMCSLDAKHGFFVLPTRQGDLKDFIQSIETVIQEYALSYYREQGKRFKKKKSKISSYSKTPGPQALSNQGWHLRYDYKMGIFAEFMQDYELALQHFILAYNTLMLLFKDLAQKRNASQSRTLPARWNELTMLADTLSFKISKFLIYGVSPIDGLFQLNRHINFFRGMRIECRERPLESFEFWGWLATQYHLFGDLVSGAMRVKNDLGLGQPRPHSLGNPQANYLTSDVPISIIFGRATPASGTLPAEIDVSLQHPGYYFLMAATCTKRRKQCYQNLKGDFGTRLLGPTRDQFFDHLKDLMPMEAEVDFASITIDLLTKSYEVFKKTRQTRMTLFVANMIAEQHMQSENYDMAMKFYDRIMRAYKKDGASELLLRDINELRMQCGSAMRNMRVVAETQLELRNVADLLETQFNFEPMNVVLRGVFAPFLDVRLQFKDSIGYVGSLSPFQISIKSEVSLTQLKTVFVTFHNASLNATIQAAPAGTNKFYVPGYDSISYSNTKDGSADLTLERGVMKVVESGVLARQPQELRVKSVGLVFQGVGWELTLDFPLDVIRTQKFNSRIWFSLAPEGGLKVQKSIDAHPLAIQINHRQPNLHLVVRHQTPVLLDEIYPIELDIQNGEKNDIRAYLKVSIKQEGAEEQHDVILFDPGAKTNAEHRRAEWSNVDLGMIRSGSSFKKQFYVQCVTQTNPRLLNITVYFRLGTEESTMNVFEAKSSSTGFYSALEESIALPCVNAFTYQYDPDIHVMTLKNVSPFTLSIQDQQGEWMPSSLFRLHASPPTLEMNWKRATCAHYCSSNLPISTPALQDDIRFDISVPPSATLDQPFEITYSITNPCSDKMKRVSVSTELNDSVVISSFKSTQFRLLPRQSVSLRAVCWPLMAGMIKVPQLRVLVNERELSKTKRAQCLFVHP